MSARRCPNCAAHLRSSNSGPLCSPCERTSGVVNTPSLASTVSAQQRADARREREIILDSLPGRVGDLAARTGIPRAICADRLKALLAQGRVVRTGEPGNRKGAKRGGQGYWYELASAESEAA